MTMVATETEMTPEDVLRLEDEGLYELVDGRLMEKRLSDLANQTATIISTELTVHTLKSGLGRVWGEQSFQCFPSHPRRVRRPDVAFIASERLGDRRFPGHVLLAPDIAVEVVSPNDTVYELELKMDDYRDADIKLIWVVYPESRKVMVHRRAGDPPQLLEGDTLTGESVLPDFAAKVADLFPPVAAGTP